jgi:pyruvate/2-oxoglutarate dehydrogenase complex dihydrolipoamide dehydrogenase (E3) component
MAERTAEEVATIFTNAGDSVTVINRLAALSSLTDEQKEEIARNVQHLEIIKAYKKEDGTTSIWTAEDFTAQDAAVTLGKTKY